MAPSPIQPAVTLESLSRAVQTPLAGLPVVRVGGDPAAARSGLDDAAAQDPLLMLVAARDRHPQPAAAAWAADRDGWLVHRGEVEGVAVLAPVSTLVTHALPGAWDGGHRLPPPPAPMPARAALVDTRREEADRLRAELVAERAWVALEAERVRSSVSWRLGHRVVRTVRLLTFRRDRGTDALGRLVERMTAPRDP